MSDPGAEQSHYEVLGVAARATQEQIAQAHAFLKRMYEDVALATYSLLGPEEVRAARARVNQAFEVLRDPERRRDYDQALDTKARPRAVLSFAPQAAPSPLGRPQETLELPGPVSGASLRQFREERGVSLHDISAASKIGVRFFEYIEADRYQALPARVYLRSFLYEYAKALGLDPRRTADDYMARLPETSR